MSSPSSVLSLDKVSLSLKGNAGQVEILRSISMDVPRASSLGLIGPSGSGKSSLLMVMGGLERATQGRIHALDTDITDLNEDNMARFRRRHMGVVFQSFHLIPTMTALENVATPLELAGDANAFDRAHDQLAAVGLDHRSGHYPAQLSGGEQQRVALARALAPKPDILLADEPTGNLDGANGERIMDLLFDLQDQSGATLILVTHAPELADRCDRVIGLNDGEIAQDSAR
ncbi:MAG: ABC transporter ATP-binding protein [Pseudomonadota bacterium]